MHNLLLKPLRLSVKHHAPVVPSCYVQARAERLMSGLNSERLRWKESATRLEAALNAVPGDAVLASAFLAYAGPMPADSRKALLSAWHNQVRPVNAYMLQVSTMASNVRCLLVLLLSWVKAQHASR